MILQKNRIYTLPIANKKGVVIKELSMYPTKPVLLVERCIASGKVTRIFTLPEEAPKNTKSFTKRLKEFTARIFTKIRK